MLRQLALGLALAAATAVQAVAVEWQVDPAPSKIVFEYQRAGQPAEGFFSEFSGSGSFAPENPDAAELRIEIRARSIDLYDTLASGFANSVEWFDTKHHPTVTYRLISLKEIEAPTYQAIGEITLRGISKTLTSRITLKVENGVATAKGTLVIDRGEFGLGVGPSAAFVEIGPEVSVGFDLTARSAN